MTQKDNKLPISCLFGFHEYTIPDKNHSCILICNRCKRSSHFKSKGEFENWFDYDENEHVIHYKDSFGNEEWWEYDERGSCVYYRTSTGIERWFDGENWIYENNSNNLVRNLDV